MSEEIEMTEAFVRDFKALHDDPQHIELRLSKFQAWCLLAAIQLASKHPEGGRTVPLQVSRMIARDLQEAVSQTPTLRRIAELGWTS
jgi:hypothetical protein